jgi:hypothetical protein
MRALGLALCLSFGVTLAASAQDATFDNPSPIDFSKPFLYDGARPTLREYKQDVALPVLVIGRDDLLDQGSPSMKELLRALGQHGHPEPLKNKSPPQELPPNCYLSVGEPFDEGRAHSCNGRLIIRTPTNPGP